MPAAHSPSPPTSISNTAPPSHSAPPPHSAVATLGDEIDALRRVAGDKIVGFIKEEIDPFVQEMLTSWNFPRFDAKRASSLGFTCEDSFDELIKTHIADELGGQIPGLTK